MRAYYFFCLLFFLTLSFALPVFAQSCDYNSSTTNELVDIMIAACSNPALFRVTICLESSTPFTGSFDPNKCASKAFTFMTPKGAASPAIIQFSSFTWGSLSLTLSNLIIDISDSASNAFASFHFPASANSDPPSLNLFDVAITGTTSPSTFTIFSLSSSSNWNTFTVSGLRFSMQQVPILFSTSYNFGITIDRLYFSNVSLPLSFVEADLGYSTFSLTNSVISNIYVASVSMFSISLSSQFPTVIANNTFQNIIHQQPNSNILNLYYHSSSYGQGSLLFQNNLARNNLFSTASQFPSQTIQGLFTFPPMDAKLLDNTFINNFCTYNSTFNISAAPINFSPYTSSNILSSDNIVKPPFTCSNGFYLSASDDPFCTACAAGSTSIGGVCALCPPGTCSSSPGSATCTACFPGYAAPSGAHSCTTCNPGFWSNGNMSSCSPCAPGTYAYYSAMARCDLCQPGYTSVAGSIGCQACPTGTFAAASASPQCYSCPSNTYQSQPAQSTCQSCFHGTCSPPGSSSCQACK